MISRLLFWLSGRLPCRIISNDHNQPYLERYYLFTLLGVRCYLHRFVGSDPDRGLHDHPWPWAGSVVLSGWYYEERRGLERNTTAQALASLMGTTGLVRRKVRWFNWLTGDSFHRVVLPMERVRIELDGEWSGDWHNVERPCWTLFFHRAVNVKSWGFLKPVQGFYGQVYFPHESGASGWWRTAPLGKFEPRRMLP